MDKKTLSKFPHLINIQEGISTLKKLHEHLELRKKYIKTDFSSKTTHEKNEIEIIILDTEIRLVKINKQIKDRTEYYNKYFASLNESYPEVEKNFKFMRKKALLSISRSDTDKAVKKSLKSEMDAGNERMTEMKSNYETKIRHYLELKNILEPEEKEEKKEPTLTKA